MKSLALLLLALVMFLSACSYPAAKSSPPPTPPSAPSSLTADATSASQVGLHWFDNSDNEQGFRLYRDNKVIATLPANTSAYQDKGLKPATNYQYVVKAYNQDGESGASLCSVRTPNPPIVVTLDRIGVVSDHDPSITGAGDIYVYVGVADGKREPQTCRIPTTSVIKLKDNETKAIGQQIFSSDSVGDELKIVVIAFESDAIHGLVWDAIGAALSSYLGGGASVAAGMITTLLKSQPSSEEGCPEGVTPESPDDDFVGAIERTWTSAKNWGIGSYEDVRSGDLRLWFTIESPMERFTSTEIPTAPTPGLTQLSFSLSVEPPQEYDMYTIPIYIKSHQTLHLNWRIIQGGDSLWISVTTPHGEVIGARADGGFNLYPTCERLVGAGVIIFSPSEYGLGEGNYLFHPNICIAGSVTVEVSYWIED